MQKFCALFLLTIWLNSPAHLWAADAATVVFESGLVVTIEDGYRQIVEALKATSGKDDRASILELNLNGGSFLLNVAEVVVVCRDECKGLKVRHQLDPARARPSG
ncbi:MAG: hypothetical protein K1X83_03130 [Oligoflexia bacterium]|nr:hypothetical protein [Oligoflexia bacterium]